VILNNLFSEQIILVHYHHSMTHFWANWTNKTSCSWRSQTEQTKHVVNEQPTHTNNKCCIWMKNFWLPGGNWQWISFKTKKRKGLKVYEGLLQNF